MINPKKFYTGFVIALGCLMVLLIIPTLSSSDNIKPIEQQINIMQELSDLKVEATKREDNELLDIIENFDNIKNPIEQDKLRLNYMIDNVSYLVENKNEGDKTYVKYLENVIKTSKKYQQFTEKKESRYKLLSYMIELATDKIEQAKTYDETFKKETKK